LDKADLYAREIAFTASGMQFTLQYQDHIQAMTTPLIGHHNVYNLLAAAAVGIVRGYSLKRIVGALATFSSVRGRLERVENSLGLNIFVDHAHKEDALRNVLTTLRQITPGRLITIFGCGGNRDTLKRPLMGRVAETLSDISIITTDNPRNEEPEHIIREILSGYHNPSRASICIDRAEAIRQAIAIAKPQDTILIAGKGHETTQIFAHQTIPFDDRKVAQEAASETSFDSKEKEP
jgi:UDP-N-acetylmuramoyl-L-alanyl-D-glutamate--2,6-diaminopimelate ligase